jgi:histidinol-phosphatase (PHP family)
MRVDYHIHTGYINHATGRIIDICRTAEARGFSEICITEHLENQFSEAGDVVLDRRLWSSYFRDIEEAARETGITVRKGVELGYDSRYLKELREFDTREFDFVLGSVHYIDGRPISKREPINSGQKSVFIRYHQLLKEMCETMDIDCIGHMDLLKKQMPIIPVSEYTDELNDLFSVMRRKDIGFELNTSGWKTRAGMCYPDPEIVKMLYDAGIRKVTIGSDCHKPDDIGYRFSDGLEVLRRSGFSKICTFENRRARFTDI